VPSLGEVVTAVSQWQDPQSAPVDDLLKLTPA
jgi:hypothetical protein